MNARTLNAETVERELASVAGWTREGSGSITRTWQRKGFNGAMQLANVVAFVANEINHHPDITVHDYNQVTVRSTTHDAGGVTESDIDLARRINAVLTESG